jgi:hypothetical protein
MAIFGTKSIQNFPITPLFTTQAPTQLDSQGVAGLTNTVLTTPADLTTITIDGHVATLSLGQMTPPAIIAAFATAGIVTTLDFLGRLVFPNSAAVTAGDTNTRTWLGI